MSNQATFEESLERRDKALTSMEEKRKVTLIHVDKSLNQQRTHRQSYPATVA